MTEIEKTPALDQNHEQANSNYPFEALDLLGQLDLLRNSGPGAGKGAGADSNISFLEFPEQMTGEVEPEPSSPAARDGVKPGTEQAREKDRDRHQQPFPRLPIIWFTERPRSST